VSTSTFVPSGIPHVKPEILSNIEWMQLMLESDQKITINSQDGKGNTFLHNVCNKYDRECECLDEAHDWQAIEWALSQGAD